ncbi:4-hydroxythreonine-4-phosphate dehydrogenase [Synechococcus sp. RSCCF101]|nr:4-hydroxythreonine-4-phosphate dehydrogenase [Synechococcus sp. RSCCF101]
MLRWLLIGGLVFGLGYGLRTGWIEWNGERVREDLNLPGTDWNKSIIESPESEER